MITPEFEKYARNEYSQFGEDGIIEKILSTLPSTDNWCVEFGAWDGMHLSNTFNLIKNKNYKSVLIEADSKRFRELETNMAPFEATLINEFVTFDGGNRLENLLARTQIPTNFDFLSIDIDGNDYWILESMADYRPKVICIEYNPSIPNQVEYVQQRDFSVKRGASAKSIYQLAKERSYELVVTTRCNLIFVDSEYFPLFAIEDNSLEALRDDADVVVFAFVGYDGTIMHSTPINSFWHGYEVKQDEIQILPWYLRRFFSDYNIVQRLLFLLFLLRRDPKRVMRHIRAKLNRS